MFNFRFYEYLNTASMSDEHVGSVALWCCCGCVRHQSTSIYAYEMNPGMPGSATEIDIDARCLAIGHDSGAEKNERVTNFAYLLIHAVADICLHSFHSQSAETASLWEL